MRRAAPRQPRQNRSGELTQIHVRCAGVRKTLIFGYSGLLIESRMSASGHKQTLMAAVSYVRFRG